MIKQTVNGFKRIFEVYPAFDKRDLDPKKNYGIGSVTMRMVVKGPEGAAQFYFSTAMHLPHVHKDLAQNADPKTAEILFRPMGYDLGYHSRKPMYEGQEPMGAKKREGTEVLKLGEKELEVPKFIDSGTFDPCEYTDGGPCYYDGSSLAAERVMEMFLSKGDDAVWEYLETYYKDTFKS